MIGQHIFTLQQLRQQTKESLLVIQELGVFLVYANIILTCHQPRH